MEELHEEAPAGVGERGSGAGETEVQGDRAASAESRALRPEGEAAGPQDPGPKSQGRVGETPALPAAPSAQDRTAQNLEPDGDPQVEIERLRGEVEEARARRLESHRRALLAENAGRVVPELVAGSSIEEMERSVEGARRAFEAARAAAMAEMASTQVPVGNPIRQGPDVEAMSPLEKIAHGLKRE